MDFWWCTEEDLDRMTNEDLKVVVKVLKVVVKVLMDIASRLDALTPNRSISARSTEPQR